MTRSVLLLLALPLLAGCNVHSKNPANGDGKVSIHADENGNISFNLPIAQGQVKVPASFMHEGDVDIDGVKLMPGSSVTGFNMDAHDHGATVDMSFTAPTTPTRSGATSSINSRSRELTRRSREMRSPASRRTVAPSRSR